MAQDFLHVDPAKQRQFLEGLTRRIYNIEHQIDLIGSRMGVLSRDWRDDEFLQFKASVEKTKFVLKQFIAEGRDVSKLLAELAKLGEDYQKISLNR